MSLSDFASRHIGPREEEVAEMLKTIGVNSVDELINQTIPPRIRLKKSLELPAPMDEQEYLKHIWEVAQKNKVFKPYLGLGYYGTITPSVILRNIFENPGWYTAYTPYQAEIAQGRLEALLNFQTMVTDLTGMELANASLLDEGTAAAEAMLMFYGDRTRDQKNNGANQFLVSEDCFPQTISILKTRAEALGIELVIQKHTSFELTDKVFGCVLQYPAQYGDVYDYSGLVKECNGKGVKVVVAADIMSLAILTPPGEWGADAVVGTTQRFGIPMGFGGPHAAYFATKEEYKRSIPGRIIGVTQSRTGEQSLRMALQTREQHIKRDKATSNICTAQVLLAVMAGMYAVYHGSEGIKEIATKIHQKTIALKKGLVGLGYNVATENFFDTIKVELSNDQIERVQDLAQAAEINLRYLDDSVCISFDETVALKDVNLLLALFASAQSKSSTQLEEIVNDTILPDSLIRKSPYLTHPVFNTYRSETEMMRYIKKLENKDISLVHSMIALGSCTMKLNAASELMPLSWPEFGAIHPYAPSSQTKGYLEMIKNLEKYLCEITGFAAMSLQPNSGAQGEYAGLMVIRAYHHDKGNKNRTKILIPSSAHGTNPASAVMAGMEVVVVKCDDKGNIDVLDLKQKAEQYSNDLAGLMVTYPSTHGVFEESIMEITDIIHQNGGLVYMDGANMNAQVGLTNPANIGADVCHLNLHKTFAIPHGGGGPGMGPIGVTEALMPYLPGNPLVHVGGEKAINAVSAAPWGSSLILLISYGYIKMLGEAGLTKSTQMAILNANYLKALLNTRYDTLYSNENNRVAHEMILECRNFKQESGIEVVDIAKRLMDYGFHAPTVSFPVAGTLMIEPTESESKAELDRFAEALLNIRSEIQSIVDGKYDKEDNPLKKAPHTVVEVVANNWEHKYDRETAAFPLAWVKEAKVWPGSSRVDDAYGDRNLICTCPAIEEYETVS